jgi:TetR/AcrR family transcriptional repressor of nem operon
MARPLEFDRCQAVEAAKAVFHRAGYEAASIDELTQALGISRASLYNTFGDKRGLLLATLDSACDQGRRMREDACARRCGAKKIIRELFEKLANPKAEGCYLLTLGAELSTSDPEVQARVKKSLEESRTMFAEILSKEERFKAKEIEEKSAVLLGAMVSILTLARVHPDRKLLKSVIEQALLVLD